MRIVDDAIGVENKDNTKGLRWFKFWSNLILPFIALSYFFGFFALLFFSSSQEFTPSHPEIYWICQIVFLIFGLLALYIAIGLRKKKILAWRLNWVIILMLGLLLCYSFVDGLHGKYFATMYSVFLLIFLLPNYLYWIKRRQLFE